MDSTDFLDPLIGGSGTKGWPHHSAPLRRSAIAAMRWNVLRGDLPLPLATVDRNALAGNLRWLQQYARGQGVALAPHGKTTMSPQLFAAQLKAGAWGLTFANVKQARVGLAAGARNVLIANQVVAEADLGAIAALLRQHPGARVLFLVDSQAQLDLIAAWHGTQADALLPFEVLLEIGLDGGRTGCRDHEQALALARQLRGSRAARLVGIECYEGLWATGRSADDTAMVQALLARVAALARDCEREMLFECDELLFSAGGSSIFDLVAPLLSSLLTPRPQSARPVRAVLRSGCYVTHDDGSYQRYMAVMDTRASCAHGLRAALRVWALVQSCPEPGLAILGAGKRDVSYDIEMPIPVLWCRRGQSWAEAAPAAWKVSALNDQHAYLRIGTVPADAPQVGDRVALGISHPCTTFDKWRWMAVVDEANDVVDAIVTLF